LYKELIKLSKEARMKILEMKNKSGSSHIGSAFSVLDILIFLYFKKLDINKNNMNDLERDKLILSKGHASAAIYVTLAIKGLLDYEFLDRYYCDNGALPGHVDSSISPSLDFSAGSLGHGLSVGVGMALGNKINSNKHKVVIVMGDGELNEGSVWEAAIQIIKLNLTNLIIVVDSNKLQGCNRTEDILPKTSYKGMFESLGFDVSEIDGHDFQQMEDALGNLTFLKPKIVIANTVKGKGVSYMEDRLEWHYKSPSDVQVIQGKKELEMQE